MPAAAAADAAREVGALAVAAAIGQVGGEAGRSQAGAGGHGQRTAERVEAVGGVGAGDQRDALERGLGNHVPADHVAEGFVDADAVQVDGQALRRAGDRRGAKAAVGEVGLEGAALDVVDVDTGEVARQVFGEGAGALAAQVVAADRLHRVRHQIAVHADARQRRGCHYHHFRQRGIVPDLHTIVLLCNSGQGGQQCHSQCDGGGRAAAKRATARRQAQGSASRHGPAPGRG